MRKNIPAAYIATKAPAGSRHVLMLGGLAQSFINFRGPLIREMLRRGHRVTAVAGNYDADVSAALKIWGAEYQVVSLARAGMNPLADVMSLRSLFLLMRAAKPDLFLSYTIKPNTYGLIAARLAGVPSRYAMITGLGYAFIDGREAKRRLAQSAATILYRLALRYAAAVIFQNSDDEAFFRRHILKPDARTYCVGGSGVDLTHYSKANFPPGPITFLMIARLLRDKGVFEFIEAARIVKRSNPDARFVLIGPLDPSPDAVALGELDVCVGEGTIEYRGAVADVRPHIARCHVYMLPSYREGTPRTVLEAMAMGRPIITTDVPGCRETIGHARANGRLVPARDPKALAEAAFEMLSLSPQALEAMGEASLNLARRRFDVEQVTAAILSIVELS